MADAAPDPPMRMDIAPRDAPTRRSGGIVSSLRRWNPTKTPKTTATLTLYLFGLFVAFVARPPVTITDQMQTRYFEMMDTADAVDAAPRVEAERLLADASMARYRAETWGWRFNSERKERVYKLRSLEKERLKEATVYRKRRDAMVKEAKGELGLWSQLGIDEAKSLFRKAYERGKLFATRSSYYDTFFLILGGRSDDSMVELLVRWGFTVLTNFTAGMFSAVVNFMWALPSMIGTFAETGWSSAIVFFIVASVSATSVAASLLLLLFGTAGGAVYGAVAVAPALAAGGERAGARADPDDRAAEATGYVGLGCSPPRRLIDGEEYHRNYSRVVPKCSMCLCITAGGRRPTVRSRSPTPRRRSGSRRRRPACVSTVSPRAPPPQVEYAFSPVRRW